MRSAFQTPYDYIDFTDPDWAPSLANYPTLKGLWDGRQAAGTKFKDSIGGSDFLIAASGVTTKSGNGLSLPAATHAVSGNALVAPGAAGSAKSALFIAVGDFAAGSLILGNASGNGSISLGKTGTVGKITSDTGTAAAKSFSAAPTVTTGAKAVLIASPAGTFGTAYEFQTDETSVTQVGANLDLTAATASGGMTTMTQSLLVGTAAQTIYGMGWHFFNSVPSVGFIQAMLAWTNWQWRYGSVIGVYPALKGIS